jgi:hypothetical protein
MTRPDQIALRTIKTSEKGLPDGFLPILRTRESRQVATRSALIYRDWLKAEDKGAEIELLAEKWGLKVSTICRHLDELKRGDRPIIAHMLAEITVLRQIKGEEVLRDGIQHRSELDNQIERYEKLRDSGEQFLIVEQTDDEGGKEGLTVKSKKLPVDTVLAGLYADRLKSQEMEAKALANYVPRPVQEHSGHIDLQILPPDTVFKEEFDRMEKLQKIEEDAEVVE